MDFFTKIKPLTHFVESLRISSYSGPYFLAFGLNTDQHNYEYGHFLRGNSPSMELTLSREEAYPPRSSNQSVSTRRAQLSVTAKAVRPTDLLNHVKTWVNTD